MAQAASSYYTYFTPHGPLGIRASARGICQVAFTDEPLADVRRATALTNAAATQIQEYLAGKRRVFDIALDPHGTAFQQLVWTEVCSIPYGDTCSAADIAEAIGKPGAHRSVGTAIRRNPTPILVPTHRVVLTGATGKIAKVFSALRALEAGKGA